MGVAIFKESSACLSDTALGETIAVAIHLKDANVVADPIQQRVGQTLKTERFCPFVKRWLAGV